MQNPMRCRRCATIAAAGNVLQVSVILRRRRLPDVPHAVQLKCRSSARAAVAAGHMPQVPLSQTVPQMPNPNGLRKMPAAVPLSVPRPEPIRVEVEHPSLHEGRGVRARCGNLHASIPVQEASRHEQVRFENQHPLLPMHTVHMQKKRGRGTGGARGTGGECNAVGGTGRPREGGPVTPVTRRTPLQRRFQHSRRLRVTERLPHGSRHHLCVTETHRYSKYRNI